MIDKKDQEISDLVRDAMLGIPNNEAQGRRPSVLASRSDDQKAEDSLRDRMLGLDDD
jgi:hypothetical protein